MVSPFTGGKVKLQNEIRTLDYRKEKFEVSYQFYVCEDTGNQFTDDELDTVNINLVHNQYRSKYGIPFPDEVRETREMYGLSASKMSEVMGFGANVYRSYELGEVPSISNGKFLQQIKNPTFFKSVLEASNQFEKDELEKLKKKIDAAHDGWNGFELVYERFLMGDTHPNELTGYRSPHLEKISNMVLFFADRLMPFKTKLNKLLFYADFLHFKRTCFSISGATYKAIQMGPVPKNFGGLYDYACEHNFINVSLIYFDHGGAGEQFVANGQKAFAEDLFEDSEKDVLNYIATKFKDITVKDIIEKSHEESAWINNVEGYNEISYLESFNLKNV